MRARRARRMTARAALPWGAAALLAACLDASNVARTDQPPALLAVEDSLSREHYGGLVVVERPSPEALRLRFRDPSRCGQPVDSLPDFARQAAARAVMLYRAPALQELEPIERVRVAFSRTHRFGVFVWTTSRGEFAFEAGRLRDVPVPARPSCGGGLPPVLRRQHG